MLRRESAVKTLTSHKNNGDHQLEDAVDEGERKHELQLFEAEGQLDDGAAQLRVLEARLQGDGSASEQSEGDKYSKTFPSHQGHAAGNHIRRHGTTTFTCTRVVP